jgi:hypothetical protein
LHQFTNNVAFHARSEIGAHIQARLKLRGEDKHLDLVSAVGDFRRLLDLLIGEELEAIPELPEELIRLRASALPTFSRPRHG